jgi:hypothetical protein
MSCTKCGCTRYFWNPVSAVQKLTSGFKASGSVSTGVIKADGTWSTLEKQDNTSEHVAYRACMCGHHKNFHKEKKAKDNKDNQDDNN